MYICTRTITPPFCFLLTSHFCFSITSHSHSSISPLLSSISLSFPPSPHLPSLFSSSPPHSLSLRSSPFFPPSFHLPLLTSSLHSLSPQTRYRPDELNEWHRFDHPNVMELLMVCTYTCRTVSRCCQFMPLMTGKQNNCVINSRICVFVLYGCGVLGLVFLSSLPLRLPYLHVCSVLYTCIFMYIDVFLGILHVVKAI